jgi:hypothetical protein
MFNYTGSPTLTNCSLTLNSAKDNGGGIANFSNSNPILTYCTFTGNSADKGGVMFNYFSSSPMVTGCTFVGNLASNGNAIAFNSYKQSYPSNIQIINSVLWDGGDEIFNNDGSTITITYSDIQDGWTGVGNIDADPLFVDPNGPDGVIGTQDDDLRLSAGSPCIDAGDNSAVDPNGTDLDGNPRILDGDQDGIRVVDMGAYEFLPPIEANVHIVPRVVNRNNRLKRIIAIVRLPEGINKADVSDEPFVLYVAGDEINSIEATWQRVIGRRRKPMVFALFDKAELMDLISRNGRVELTVTGKLKSGRCISGSDTIRIIQPRRRRRLRWRHR